MNPIVEKVYQIGIIPVIAFNSVDEALPLCKALAEGGLPAAEVTFRTACAEECIRKIHEEMPEMLLGAGTVLTTEQADRAMACLLYTSCGTHRPASDGAGTVFTLHAGKGDPDPDVRPPDPGAGGGLPPAHRGLPGAGGLPGGA